jgi:nucleotide-binding universal stress UspA family protein
MPIQVRRILVPLDFSPSAEAVLEWAVHLAEEHGSTLVLLHAYHLPAEFQSLEGAYLPPDFWTSVKTEAGKALAQHAEAAARRGVAVETVLREGHPASVIEEEAERQRADLVVIGTRGLTGLKHLLLGSVAERVVQRVHCPVLTVKMPPAPAS